MPEVRCPIADCDYKTPDIEASIVTALIEAHCRTHINTSDTNLSSWSTNNPKERNITPQSGRPMSHDKMQSRERIGLVLGLALCVLTLIVDITFAFVPQRWFRRQDQFLFMNTTTTVGLWRGCVVKETADERTEQCWDHDDKNFPFNFMFVGAAQVFQCLGVIFMVCAIIAVILKLTIARTNESLVYFAGMFAIWAAVFFAGSSAVISPGLKKISTQDTDYTRDVDISSAVAFLIAFVALVGGIVLLLNKFVTSKMANKYNTVPIYKGTEDEDINL